MKKSKHKILQVRHRQFLNILQTLTDYMDSNYPDWQNGKDADYIKKRLNKTAKIMSKNQKQKKTKLLKKKDFKEWPFKTDSVIIVQTSKLMISVIINFREYALNGLAHTGLNLKFPHDCGLAIVGKSVSEFIRIGKEL